MYPLESLGDCASLVALNRADEMPLKWKVIQVVDLLEGFLDVTLSEGSLATSERSSNIFGRKSLAHRHELDIFESATSRGGSSADASGDRLQPL
jgi:hypothetical protein